MGDRMGYALDRGCVSRWHVVAIESLGRTLSPTVRRSRDFATVSIRRQAVRWVAGCLQCGSFAIVSLKRVDGRGCRCT